MVLRAVLMKSGLVSINIDRQNISKTAILVNTTRQVNTTHLKTIVNVARPMSYLFKTAHSTVKRPINNNTIFKNSNINQRVNTVRGKNINTARPKIVVNVVQGNNVNAVKASACWVWKSKTKVLDQVSKHNSASTILKRNKKDERGIVIRNKTRLVSQGHTQEEGIDYDEVFSHVARIEAIRLFLVYASFKDFMVYQMDVKSAFLYGKIEEEVYVCQPPGFEDPNFLDRVYKVEKALYGLHQAPKAWYETLSTYLLDNEFQRGKIDKTLFIKRYKGDILLVQVYVDDIIFGSIKKELCNAFEKLMHEKFQMSSMGELTFFWGLQVQQKNDDEDGEEVDVHMYRSMIGSLMYLTSSRPDIMFVVCACARYQVNLKFWSTVKAKTVNEEVQLQALVDGKKIIITELTVRRDLQLEDAKGVDYLPNSTIFEQLTLMGYEKISQKLTFYKAFFSPQWKFLIHTILQCLSSKTTAWNEFSSTMASAIICLATNQKFNFSKYIFESMVKNLDNVGKFLMYPRFIQVFLDKQLEGMPTHNRIYIAPSHTKKIFGNMSRVRKGFSERETPLFPTMVVKNQAKIGEGSAMATDPHHTPTIIQPSTSQPQKKQKPRKPKRKDTEVPQPSGPTNNVANEAVYEKIDDSLERADTTATSLDAEQDRGDINKTQSKATLNEPSSTRTSSNSGLRRQDTMGDTIAQTGFENVSKTSND
ncbi:retrovirus-related pol polyprotein from transposon TNT 1-94, partial [Tanacetum coccineum]